MFANLQFLQFHYGNDEQAVYDEEGGSQEWSALQDEDCSGLPSDDLLKNAGALFGNINVINCLGVCRRNENIGSPLHAVQFPIFSTDCIFPQLTTCQ